MNAAELARLEAVADRLERLTGATTLAVADAPELLANPAEPPGVATGEIITSAWGNGVVASLVDFETRIAALEGRVTTVEAIGQAWHFTAGDYVQMFGGGVLANCGSFVAPTTGLYMAIGAVFVRSQTGILSTGNVNFWISGSQGYVAKQFIANTQGTTLAMLHVWTANGGVSQDVKVAGALTGGDSLYIGERAVTVVRVRT